MDTKEEKIFTTKIIVLGTNHTSSSDAEKVTRIIEDEKPDVVVVELDFERLNSNSDSYKIGGKDFMNAVKSENRDKTRPNRAVRGRESEGDSGDVAEQSDER